MKAFTGILLVVWAWGMALRGEIPPELLSAAVSALPEAPFSAAGFHAAEGFGSGAVVEGAGDDPAVFRVVVTKPPPNQWEVGMGWPCGVDVSEGDALLLTFEARTISQGGLGDVRAVFRRRAKPYLHCLSDTVHPGGQWRSYAFVFAPGFTESAGDALLILNFGARAQETELRGLRLLSFGDSVSLGRLMRSADADVKQAARRAVGTPLTPGVLWEMGVVDGFGGAGRQATPGGGWVATYTIWTCHGYQFHANRVVGMLRVERGSTEDGHFGLRVRQDLVNDEGILHRVEVDAVCREDRVASPVRWSLRSTFLRPDGDVVAGGRDAVLGEFAAGRWLVRRGGRAVERLVGELTATDWGLFEATGRLPFQAGLVASFDLLEGFSLHKSGHVLRYRGSEAIGAGSASVELHRFTLVGHGTLPYEFWVDSAHRVVLVVTHSRAYLLDAAAESEYRSALTAQQRRFEKIRSRLDARKEAD